MLQATLAESQATRARLRATVQARDVYLRTLQHRMKTTLQLAISLFNLQRAQYQDPHFDAPFAASAQRLRVLALFHQALEQAGSAPRLDGTAYLLAVHAAVIRSARVDTNRILLATHLEPLTMPLTQATPCGLILNELLTNAVTHAFPEGRSDVVTIELRGSPDGTVTLQVTDSGVGVPEGLDIRQPTRLGWLLVTLLTEQLHGSLTLERGQGTRITVRFPH